MDETALSRIIPRSSNSSSARAMLPALSPILLPSPRPVFVSGPAPQRSAARDGIENLEGGGVFGRIVNPEYGGTIGGRREIGGERANEVFIDRRGGMFSEQRLTRNPDEDRQGVVLQRRKIGQGRKILRSAFAETDAGIENDTCGGDTSGFRKTQRTVEEPAHVRDDVEIGIDAGAIVHQNHCRAGFGDRVGHGTIFLQSPNIVDHACAEFCCATRDLGFGRIDRKRNVDATCQLAENGREAGELLFRRDGRMAWARGFRPHIDNVGAICRELFRLLHGGIEAEEFAAIGEGIGRYIQYAHDEGPRAQKFEKPVTALDHGGGGNSRNKSLASVSHEGNDPCLSERIAAPEWSLAPPGYAG